MRLLSHARGAFLLALLVALGACGKPTQPPPSQPATLDLELSARDGMQLKADRYLPVPREGANADPPGLVLVHALGADRRAWDTFAERARRAGFMAVAFDMRGHGESTRRGPDEVSYRTFSTSDWLSVLDDIDAAKTALIDAGANRDNIVVVGASIGANLALHYAVKHPDIPAVVMVSPGLDYKGIGAREALAALGERPVLLMTSTGDSYSAATCTALKALAPGHCELREYSGTAHGTDLLDAAATALDQVFLWLEPIVGPQD